MTKELEPFQIPCSDFEGDATMADIIPIELKNSLVFDLPKFDSVLLRMKRESKLHPRELKWIAADDWMFIFRDNFIHIDLYTHLQRVIKLSILNSAGDMDVVFPPGLTSSSSRTIDEYSVSLSDYGLLSRANSNRYKQTVIARRLSPFFEIR